MRAFVFTDKSLASEAGRFVWLAIDTEKTQNATFRKQFPVPGLPSFFIVDPATEKVALRWLGGATAPQLQKILADGRAAVRAGGRPNAKPKTGADAALSRADALFGAGKDADAAAAYREALAQAPAQWSHAGRATEALLFALQNSDQCSTAVRLARDAFPKLRHSPSVANVATIGLDCAVGMPAEAAERQALISEFETAARAVAEDMQLQIAADDRSGVYISLLGAREDAHDATGAREVATRWAAFLDGEAARAKTPDARAVFDSHRLSAYIELGQPERAIPMLQASERDLPDDYNPPARLAVAYKAMQQWDEALAASDRALAKVYGPRQLSVLQTRADIYLGRGDAPAARTTLEKAIQVAEALPSGQRSESQIASLKKKLDTLPKS